MPAKFVHILNEFPGGSCGQAVCKKRFTIAGTDQRPVGTDQPNRKAEFSRDRQSIVVAASSGQNDLNAGFMRCAQGGYVARGHLKIRVSQCAVNIQGQQTDGISYHESFYSEPSA